MTSMLRSSRGLRIAHLIETDGPGGAERVLAHIATTLQRAGASNVVFLPEEGEGWLARELEGSGVVLDRFHLERAFSPRCARLLADAFRRHRVDVAHSHEFAMGIYGAWAARRVGIPHVITMHGSRYYARRLRRRLALRLAMWSSETTAAVSETLARALTRDLHVSQSSIATVPNGVLYIKPEISTLREELRLADADRLAVSVGNLYEVKGHRYLIDAIALLANRQPTLHLAIAGRGNLDGALAARAEEHGIAARVHLLGLRSDVTAVLAAADVFVLPSLSEAMPLALLEAMFAERPIVATDVGEVPIALEHGSAGLLVPPGDARALADAVDAVLSNEVTARRLAERAGARARTEYDVSRMVSRYLDVYRTLTGRASPDEWIEVAAVRRRPTS